MTSTGSRMASAHSRREQKTCVDLREPHPSTLMSDLQRARDVQKHCFSKTKACFNRHPSNSRRACYSSILPLASVE